MGPGQGSFKARPSSLSARALPRVSPPPRYHNPHGLPFGVWVGVCTAGRWEGLGARAGVCCGSQEVEEWISSLARPALVYGIYTIGSSKILAAILCLQIHLFNPLQYHALFQGKDDPVTPCLPFSISLVIFLIFSLLAFFRVF